MVQQQSGRGLCQREHALTGEFGFHLIVNIRLCQQQRHGAGLVAGIDGEAGAKVVGQGGVDDDKIVGLVHHLPPRRRNVAHETNRIILRTGEHRGEGFVEFLRGGHHQNAVRLVAENHGNAPSFQSFAEFITW